VNKPPIIVAHRGLHRAHPENSAAALELAIKEGFWVECDVHASRDGVPVIIHDETVDRTAESCGRVDSFSAAELEHITLKRSGETISTLDRALSSGGNWLVEIKPPRARSLVRRVVDHLVGRSVQWVVQSFDADNVLELWAYHPQARGALLVEDSYVLDRAIRERWPAVHVAHEMLTPDVHSRLRDAGASIGVWTVNEPRDIERVLELEVDTLITDEPWRARYATESRASGT
jgi:glycerophosphoryl diester phosphodiesterase